MAELTIKTRSAEGDTILDLSGKVAIGDGSVQLRSSVREALESGQNKILLNLADVFYMDSSGIGELVSAYTTTNNQGGSSSSSTCPEKFRIF